MASTIAFFSGLSGLNANARNLDVIGNNIANVNTTAFKSSRLQFGNLISLNYSLGSAPGANHGGTNPYQVGLGVGIAGTQRDTTGGSISGTGDDRDLAIEGEGYFLVDRGDSRYYTRAGSFRLNAQNELTNISGDRLKGYGVDDDFNVLPGALQDLVIPLGSMTIAEATTNVQFEGNLDASGDPPTQGTTIALNAFGLTTGPVGGNQLEETSLLTDIQDPSATTPTSLFTVGQQILISGATKGSKTLPDATFTIAADSTVDDFMSFLNDALGINTTTGNNPDGRTPGVSLDPATGVISITGNVGTVSELEIASADMQVLDAAGNLVELPFTPLPTAEADGESVRTTFVVYDSRGTPMNVDITFVLESNSSTGSTWRYFAESADDSDVSTVVGSGTINFDVFGQPIGTTTGSITIDREDTGAATAQTITLDFNSGATGLTSLTSSNSRVESNFQDGSSLGTLTSYGIGEDGVITGNFTNGANRTLGQVALAKFINPAGLVDIGSNLYAVGANSGDAVVTAPGELGTGRLIPGALELSNVDLSEEFINLILSSTGYSASSRVITTTDQLMQQLLVIGR